MFKSDYSDGESGYMFFICSVLTLVSDAVFRIILIFGGKTRILM